MNYYQFHIGDFRSGTVNMSRKARWIYRDMLDIYYDTEKPLPADMDILCEMLGIEDDEERKIVERHLRFKFDLVDGEYRHQVCDSVIAEYHSKAEVARANGKKGGRPKAKQDKPSGFQSGCNPVENSNQQESGSKTNHKPITNNQEPIDQKPLSPDSDPDELPKAPRMKYAEVQQVYNEICPPTFPACAVMNEKRKKQIRAMCEIDFMGNKPFRKGIEVWRQYFTDCLTDRHWCGDNARGWTADFDFVTKPANAIKLMERMN